LIVCRLSIIVCRLSFLVHLFSFIASRLSFVVYRFSFVVSRLSFLVCRFSFAVTRFRFVVCRLPFAVYRLSFVVSRLSFLTFWKQIIGFRSLQCNGMELARASGSGPTRQNLSPDLRIRARAGRAAISISTPLFYENHEVPENRLGYTHSKLKDFRESGISGNPGNPSILSGYSRADFQELRDFHKTKG
jgi:hypothetical protein